MTIFFKNSNGDRRTIGEALSFSDATKIVSDFLKEHNYKSYYQRYWYLEDTRELMIDVGSHTEFFIIKDWDGKYE